MTKPALNIFSQRPAAVPTAWPVEAQPISPAANIAFEAPEASGQDVVALRRVLHILWHGRSMIAATTLITTALVSAYLLIAPSKYTAQALLMIDPREQRLQADILAPGASPEAAALDSQLEILRSPRIAERVIADETAAGSSAPKLPGAAPGAPRMQLDSFLQQLDVRRREQTYLIEVNVTDRTPERAARLANAVVDSYLADTLEARAAVARETTRWLDEHVSELRKEVADAEQRVQDYKVENNIVEIGGQSLIDRQIGEQTQQLIAARSGMLAAEARLKQLESSGSGANQLNSSGRALQSQVISEYRRQFAELKRKEGELISRYGENHPEVDNVRAELEKLSREIDAELGRLVESTRSEYAIAQSQVTSIEQSLQELKRQQAERDKIEIGLTQLEREAKATSELHSSLLVRLKELEVQASMRIPQARVISRAVPPTQRSNFRKTLVLAFGCLAGLCIGGVLTLGRETFRSDFRTAEDVERILGMRAVTVVPDAGDPEAAVATKLRADTSAFWRRVSTVVGSLWASRGSDAAGADEDRAQCEEGADGEAARPGDAKHIVLSFHGQATSPYANAILSLKQAIDRHTRKLQSCVVTVVSASNGDGKSVTAVNLAALCAASGARTLLLDCDLRTPSLAARLVRGNPPSLADIVKSGVALEDAVVHTDMGFDFCGGAGAEENHALETFASPRLIEILSEAKALYEFVILDTSSLLDYPDARAALAASDVAVLVLRSNHTTFSAAQAVVRDIELAGASSLEVVLNRTKPTAHLQSA